MDPIYHAAETVLTGGFRIGAGLLALGIVLTLVRDEELEASVNPFPEVIPAVLDGRATGFVDLAILWMVAVPVVVVLVVAVGFARIADRRYAMLSLLALAVLGFSIGLALARG
jgi:hypothetical protein